MNTLLFYYIRLMFIITLIKFLKIKYNSLKKMEISKIKSSYSLNHIFSFISEKKRKYNIIKYNNYLNKKLDLSIDDYKEYFFQKK